MTAAGVTSSGSDRGVGPEQAGGSASIGSVLDALRADFPEITISKIRFLESEGLISPSRTPSGYRQFSAADVARLRFVLSAQRDHYLPLKVIRAKLDEFDRAPTPGGPTLAGEPAALATAPAPSGPTAVPSRPTGVATAPVPHGGGGGGPGGGGSGGGGPRDPRDPSGVTGGPGGGSRSAGPVPPVPVHRERSAPPGAPGVPDAVEFPADDAPGPDRAALLAVDGVDEALLEGLASHGILRADSSGRYEPEAPLVARTAAALSVLGVEPRLLRGLRAGAEREAGLLTQLVTPVARGRAPGASDRAAELSRELATLSGRLHTLLVAAGLRDARR